MWINKSKHLKKVIGIATVLTFGMSFMSGAIEARVNNGRTSMPQPPAMHVPQIPNMNGMQHGGQSNRNNQGPAKNGNRNNYDNDYNNGNSNRGGNSHVGNAPNKPSENYRQDNVNHRKNDPRNNNQATAPKEEHNTNVNNNDTNSQETNVRNKNNNNNRVGNRRNEINDRKTSPAKIVRDIDKTHDATYDEDDRYKAQRESYYENDGKGRIVDHQVETIDDRHRVSATESDTERGRETIINRYEGENDRRGNRGNGDEGRITVVVNNNIPIENNVNVDIKAENKNENNNDVKIESENDITSTNNNNNDNDNTNKTEANVGSSSTGETSPESKPNPTPSPTPNPSYQTGKIWGDVDSNGKVEVADSELLLKYIQEKITSKNLDLSVADVNIDGQINIMDSVSILNYAKGKIESNTEGNMVGKPVIDPTGKKRLRGDLNRDNVLSAEDAELLRDYVFEGKGYFSLKEADYNNDGEIDIVDVQRLIECVFDGKSLGYIDNEPKLEIVESHFFPCTGLKKPVIYLYPTVETSVNVKLSLNGEVTCTYPKINDGWNVVAEPDGMLTDKDGKHYNYLFWEGVSQKPMDFSTGFCVAGKDVEELLQDKLSYMGMNEKEINDFMVYWLPQMQNNPYNVISFQTKNYVENAVLDVTPAPDTMIRVFMAWKKSDEMVDIEEQQLECVERKGFTLVEWGGCEVIDNAEYGKLQ